MNCIFETFRHEFKIRQYCRLSENRACARRVLWLEVGCSLLVATVVIGLALCGAVIAAMNWRQIQMAGVLLAFAAAAAGGGVCMAKLAWIRVCDACGIYSFGTDGIRVKYPLRREIHDNWDAFQEICVCDVNFPNPGMPRDNPAICFIRHGEKKDVFGRWKTDVHTHFRSAIAIDYSEERLEQLRRFCPYPVLDYRRRGSERR